MHRPFAGWTGLALLLPALLMVGLLFVYPLGFSLAYAFRNEQTGGWEPRHVEYATNHVAARVTENVEADWSALATEAVALVKAPRRALGAGGGGHPSSRPEHLQRTRY